MFTMNQLIAGTSLALLAHDIKTQLKTHKVAKLYQASHEASMEQLATQNEQIKYLCQMLNDHEIVPTEFDKIALNYNN